MAQQSGILDQLKNTIGSGGEKAVADKGTRIVVVADRRRRDERALPAPSGDFAGIDPNTSKSLLGMLGPIVAGVVGQQQRSAGLDSKGLTSLLTSQKDTIAAAMPSGFASLLGGTGLLDGLGRHLEPQRRDGGERGRSRRLRHFELRNRQCARAPR